MSGRAVAVRWRLGIIAVPVGEGDPFKVAVLDATLVAASVGIAVVVGVSVKVAVLLAVAVAVGVAVDD